MPTSMIDTEAKVSTLVTSIVARPSKQHLIFIDLEGVDLSRHGSVSIMQVLLPPEPTVHLVDVHVLGVKAFTAGNADGVTLQSLLESNEMPKVFFDVRNDSDALFSHFRIHLRCVIDLQVMEFASRPPGGRFVKGLAKCVSEESSRLPNMPQGWQKRKDEGRKLFVPELGGKYEVFLERPMAPELVDYCELDMMMMPGLLAIYARRLGNNVAAQLQDIVDARIALSQSASFNGQGRHMAVGPSITRYRSRASTSLTFPMSLVCGLSIADICRVDTISQPQIASTSSPKPEGNTSMTLPALAPPIAVNSAADLLDQLSLATSNTDNNIDQSSSVIAVTDELADTTMRPEPYSSSYLDDDYEEYALRSSADSPDPWDDLHEYDKDDSEKDLTACDIECGYCGHCMY